MTAILSGTKSLFDKTEEVLSTTYSFHSFQKHLMQVAKEWYEEHGSFYNSKEQTSYVDSIKYYETICKEERHMVQITDCIYDKFMEEIMALPPKKRKNWKGTLTDKWGQHSKCRYKNDKIENLSNKLSAGYGEWVEVITPTQYMKQMEEQEGTLEQLSLVGAMTTEIDKALFEKRIDKETAHYFSENVIEQVIEYFRTGNHYRNQSVMCGAGLYGRGK